MRRFKAIIWIGGNPGIRVSVDAESAAAAREQLEEEYGEGHTISVWNEEDAAKPR